MRENYDLFGYGIRYFLGEPEAYQLVKKLNKFLKNNQQLEISTVNVAWEGEDIGWVATVVYMGTVNED
jgi:hypothetical protein